MRRKDAKQMDQRTRTVKVWVLLMAAMTIGALALMALDKQPLSIPPFSLSAYTSLNPIEEVTIPGPGAAPYEWNNIEIYYSQTTSGSIEELAKLNNLNSGEVNFHFLIHNGSGAADGLIKATQRWLTQNPCRPGGNWYGSSGTIRICIIADGITTKPTATQLKRTSALIESLVRQSNLMSSRISYPLNWQL